MGEMMSRKFLVPVGVAVAALLSTESGKAESKANVESKDTANLTGVSVPSVNAQEELTYLKEDEYHKLLMRKSDNGMIFADHSSHSSHSSHRSG
jgi:hypothetical protein